MGFGQGQDRGDVGGTHLATFGTVSHSPVTVFLTQFVLSFSALTAPMSRFSVNTLYDHDRDNKIVSKNRDTITTTMIALCCVREARRKR